PTTVLKSKDEILGQTKVADSKKLGKSYAVPDESGVALAADPVIAYMSKAELEKQISKTQKQMEKAAKEMDFMEAARLRDEYFDLKKLLET
ncbi:UvrB/UvrC motif-containing protein, partial [Streptococcus pyogenes]